MRIPLPQSTYWKQTHKTIVSIKPDIDELWDRPVINHERRCDLHMTRGRSQNPDELLLHIPMTINL